MKKNCLILSAFFVSLVANAQTESPLTAWSHYPMAMTFDNYVAFNTSAEGENLPILWGFDTAWNDYANMLRGVRYSGKDAVSCARVSFQPWAEVTNRKLPTTLQRNLDARMTNVALIGKKVDIVLNLDGGDNTIKSIYGGYEYEDPSNPWYSPKKYIGDVVEQGPHWADLIDATAAAVEAKGYTVITASPLNEPDLELNGTPIELFYQIAKNLKDYDKYPRFKNIRISGGNTLNNDEASKWYEYNKEYLDEGNTHQLAGGFDTYADFFRKVREDGKHATADELHNVMEAMVGVEYGMQTGIWWGTAERARGEFMKASFGRRIGYAENRKAWSAASVYRTPQGKYQGFVGCSERQARPSAYNFVSANGAFFVNGMGPLREYVATVPGDPNGAYQTEQQRNAEAVLDMSIGTDIQPYLHGDYTIINCGSKMAISCRGGQVGDGVDILQDTPAGKKHQIWNVDFVPETWGGDFSYYFIKNINGSVVKSLDDNNWNLDVGGKVISYAHSGAAVQQWAMEYAGDGKFRIRNKHSALYLTVANSTVGCMVLQQEYAENQNQLWRFIPASATVEYSAPSVPGGLTAAGGMASVSLSWQPSTDAQSVTYTIARADGADGEFNVIARGLADTRFLDNGLSDATSYRYIVQAEDAAGNRSAYSKEANAAISGEGVIAHYALENDAADATPNRFDMKLIGSASFRTSEGRKGLNMRSLACQLPYSALASDEFTVSLWFRATVAQSERYLFCTGFGDSKLSLFPANEDKIELRAENGEESVSLTAPNSTGSWTHLAITVSDEEVTLYVNGKPATSGDGREMRRILPAQRVLTFLGSDINRGNMYTGMASDLRIYNEAITPEEVADLAGGSAGVEDAFAGQEIDHIEYYAPSGMRIYEPSMKGVTIVRTVYSNGAVKIEKKVN